MTNRIEWKPSGLPTNSTFNVERMPFNATFKDKIPFGSISSVIATYNLDGTGCAQDAGASYNITWTPDQYVVNSMYNVQFTLTGGGGPNRIFTFGGGSGVGAAQSDERNDYAGNPVTYIITWDLIYIPTTTILSSGTVAGSPGGSIFNITTNCSV